jgi:glycosyltransferase involved in cell wall biosynthesis
VIPEVSIITPTWQRHDLLLNRCIPSVQAQTFGRVEHVVVSDGPDPELREKMRHQMEEGGFTHPVTFYELPEHKGRCEARMTGISMAQGEYIAYIDDDDALRPEHCQVLYDALFPSGKEWAYSVMESHHPSSPSFSIGYASPAMGAIGTPMIMHRRRLLEHASWGPDSRVEDWELVQRWLAAGFEPAFAPEVTVDVYPSVYWPGA